MIEQLGPYRIEKQIGRGGMGAVYAGVNEETGEKAAIKILAAGFAEDRAFRGRFLSEIETLKQLRHHNIVRLLGDGEQDGQLFYVMELVEGRSLQEELQAGHQYDWRETTEIAIQICQALKHAHDHGVIHRDLKPANLLRSPDNEIKLTDFGIAKLFGGSQLTAAGSVVGTADFMSPEQAEGRAVNHRSDLYSLGTVMFTLLARRPPFAGTSLPQVVHKLRYEEAPSVRRFAPNVPAELEQIISQLLSKDPEQRMATALALANRLRAMLHGLAILDKSANVASSGDESPKPSPAAKATDEQVTRISNSSQSPKTELNPTAVDDFELRDDIKRESGGASWNDATLVTGEEVSGDSASGNGVSATGMSATGVSPTGISNAGVSGTGFPATGFPATGFPATGFSGTGFSGTGVSKSQQTVVETSPPVNRFTTIEADQHRKRQETIDKSAQRHETIKVMVMTIALFVVVGLIVWSLRPASADDLYTRIVKTKATTTVADAEKQIDEFLARYPDDPRADEVTDYQLEIASERHFSKLVRRARKETLAPVEAKYVQAMKDRAEKPAEARRAFLDVLRGDGAAGSDAEEVQHYVDYARYQLEKLTNLPEAPAQAPGE